MKPSDEQQAVYDHTPSMREGDVLKVISFAGSGKSTTLKGVAKRDKRRGVYLVFNKANADEARQKFALTNCTASTIHSLAHGAMRDYMDSTLSYNAKHVRESGAMSGVRWGKIKGWNDYRLALAVNRTLREFCGSADPEITEQHARAALISSVGDPDFLRSAIKREKALETINAYAADLVTATKVFTESMMGDRTFSFDLYLKMLDLNEQIRNDAFRDYRYILLDEAQDQNPVQLSIIRKTGLPLIAVGDPYQQLYSWRGAVNALGMLQGKELYLTQCYRFGEPIAEIARHILAMRPDGGPQQRLVGAGGDIKPYEGPMMAMICRTNMGVLETALDLLAKGKDFQVDNMKSLIKDLESAEALYHGDMTKVVAEDITPFDSWDELKSEASEGNVTLARYAKIIEDGRMNDLRELNARQTDAQNAKIMVCTAHRSKGMEWAGVQLGNDWQDIHSLNHRYQASTQKSEQHQTMALEEFNALYVACTRPMVRLGGHEKLLFAPPPEPREEVFGP